MKTWITSLVLAFAMPLITLHAEKVAYIGIVTSSADNTLKEQLSLPSGLVVKTVESKSPASSVLKKHDILTKLDDQLLMNPEQLSALVKGKKSGDKIRVEFLRAGNLEKSEIVLGETDLKANAGIASFDQIIPGLSISGLGGNNGAGVQVFGGNLEDIDDLQKMIDEAFGDDMSGVKEMARKMAEGAKNNSVSSSTSVSGNGADISISINGQKVDLGKMIDLDALTKGLGESGNTNNKSDSSVVTSTSSVSSVAWSENGVTYQMNTKDGESTLKITDGDEVIFEGPCNNDEERKAIPEKYQEGADRVTQKGNGADRKPARNKKKKAESNEDSTPGKKKDGEPA